MALYNKHKEMQRNYRDVTFQSLGSKSLTTKVHFRIRLIDLLSEIDAVFGPGYKIVYGSQIVSFNVPLSNYVKDGNFTFDVIKFSPTTVDYILDESPSVENIEVVVLNKINETGLMSNLTLSLTFDNVDPNEMLSNGCRCRFNHYVCRCSSKTKYSCVCKNLGFKKEYCYHYYYLKFSPCSNSTCMARSGTHNCCNIWTTDLNQLCEICRKKITYIIYAIFYQLDYRRSWDQFLNPIKQKTVSILYSYEFEMFVERFRSLIKYYFAHWILGNYVDIDVNDIVPGYELGRSDIKDIIKVVNGL
jgi:hypothetical protein